MTKQQLASKIWASANKMRSNIEASEYKDYILGFIFYKFLSEKEEQWLIDNLWDRESFSEELIEHDKETVDYIKQNIGYFISYENLFSTWLKIGKDFTISNVKLALSAFNRNIDNKYRNVFDDIFVTLDTGLTKLGNNSQNQTKAVRDLIDLIRDIPMDNSQDYDVLGFIYEYLISNFAANAGKKAGEFYTPHEVSLLMSEIVAYNLRDKEEIKIYDPTSGSGSLLINIGKCVGKHMNNSNNISYYAQELIQATYNLTRMNLVMRGILPSNIITRCGDTLNEDWPYFDETHSYNPLYVDAVVSNPPYSQSWDPDNHKGDVRFANYGYAPKSKADYAFLLHDLYHLKPDGIMTIVLPHGVLFRGGEEEQIRKNLIENNNIDAIIGLPADIFFGTGIPTIIIVLKKQRSTNDVLIIDASKHFIKDSKKNRLQASDIKRIVDTYIERKTIDKFSKVVSKEEIQQNDYNLNIPRYVDSNEESESIDLYASMFGGIPLNEIDSLKAYWDVFPSLKEELFNIQSSRPYADLKVKNVEEAINNSKEIISYKNKFESNFSTFNNYLYDKLISNIMNDNINTLENDISLDIRKRLVDLPLVDEYKMYQSLDDCYKAISQDLEIIQAEGLESINMVQPHMVIKKKDSKEYEVQDGYEGKIIPFDLIEEYYFKDELNNIDDLNDKISIAKSSQSDIFEELDESQKAIMVGKESIVNANCDAFSGPGIKAYVKPLLKSNEKFDEDSIEAKLIKVANLMDEEKSLNKELKKLSADIKEKDKAKLESLTIEECNDMLSYKWINPIESSFKDIFNEIISKFTDKVLKLSKKYDETLVDLSESIKKNELELADMIDDLTGSESDMEGLLKFQKLLRGDVNE